MVVDPQAAFTGLVYERVGLGNDPFLVGMGSGDPLFAVASISSAVAAACFRHSVPTIRAIEIAVLVRDSQFGRKMKEEVANRPRR